MPIPPSSSPAPAELARAKAARASFLTRITQFPAKHVSVVPYAPERLSITQDVFTPTMQETLLQAQSQRQNSSLFASMKKTSVGDLGLKGDVPPAPSSGGGEEKTGNTLFAALRMRRALHRSKAGRDGEPHELEPKVDETQANINRHIKVLSRYKIRRVDIAESETTKLKDIGLFLVNPHSTIFKLWQLSTLIIIIYQSILLPYSLAFGWNQSSAIDTATNLIFFFDILIAFNTPVAASDDESEYICDRIEIARIYCRGWLFFDLLACIPFDNLIVWINNYDSSGTSSSNLNVLGLLKALRIPRLLRLVRLLRVVKVLKIRPEIRRWLQYSRHANLLRLVRLVLSFLILNHYAACIWFGAVASDQTKAHIVNHDPMHLYVVSFYTTLLVIQGQNLDELFTDGEYIFCISAMLFGAIVMAVVFGNVAILIANYYENQSSHQKKMEWLFSSMTRMKLPMDLQNRINDYYQAMWERHGTLDGAVTAFIPELSRNLAYEVELFLRMDMINRAPIFQSCSAKVVQELVMELELQVFMPGDYIVVRGEVGNDMYFVQNGVCEVTKDLQPPSTTASFQQVRRGTVDASANEIILKTLGQGDYFGEIALLMNCKRTANVRAHVFSELCALTRQVFENISMRYLEDRTIIEKFIMDKYDPGMLQAAMKQSHELAMRGHVPNVVRGSTPTGGSEADTGLELLRKIDERLVRLEQRIDRESNDRRDSEIRMAAVSSGPRFEATLTAQQNHSSPMRGDKADFVLFEPERMSQRHLQLSPLGLQRGSSKAAQIAEITESPHPVDGPIYDGEATDEHADQKRSVWKRPSVHRSGSWRNARREGSAGSLRLRGIAKPSAASNTRHSSRAASLTAAISAAEAVSVHHSSLKREPSLRNGSLNSSSGADRSTAHNEQNREDEEDRKSERDRDREQGLLSADSLDALANTFAEMTEQRDTGV